MKTQQFNKKLTLNKATVENLNGESMKEAKGGYFNTRFYMTCQSWCGCQTNFYHCPTDETYICP